MEDRSVYIYRDSVISLVPLHRFFGLPSTEESDLGCHVVFLGIAEKRIGLIVNEVLFQQEVVIKPVGDYLNRLQGISGVTILGDGRIALIIDPFSMITEIWAGGR